ncbi:endo-1,4-beta-xylanase [Nocardia sp. NPDC058480]|uniref:endo-1,4-beta-xylanase n=1 Tax=unclassified Nocardia TaxID=2637762 RepID=UPI00365C751E
MTEFEEPHRERIGDGNEQLLRPIISRWVVNGVVAPDAFLLSTADKKDSNHLSIARGSATTPEVAYKARAESIQKRCAAENREYTPPIGVLSLSVTEVESVEVESAEGSTRQPLTVWDDSMNEGIPEDHGHIDYNEVPPSDKGAHIFAAKTLALRAQANGWKYGPFSNT